MKVVATIDSSILVKAVSARYNKKAVKLAKTRKILRSMQILGKVQGLVTITQKSIDLQKEVEKLAIQRQCKHPQDSITRYGVVHVCGKCSASVDEG